ncbi:MAG TPA: hypothetical protein VIY29_15405 [Ktedonobacteraceae bacterium]
MPTYQQHPNLYPFETRVEADLWDRLPTTPSGVARACARRLSSICPDEMQVTFHPTRQPRVV